jgi:hypothetical protein
MLWRREKSLAPPGNRTTYISFFGLYAEFYEVILLFSDFPEIGVCDIAIFI